jgi:hypothetical protein
LGATRNRSLDGVRLRGATSKKRGKADQGDHQTPEETTEVQEVLELGEEARRPNQLEDSEGHSDKVQPGARARRGCPALRVDEKQRNIRESVRTVGRQ